MNNQHFQGSGEQENGRIRIELDPEFIEDRSEDSSKDPGPSAPDAENG